MAAPKQPTDVSEELTLFDRFADRANTVVSRAPFFAFCLLLLVALLQNSQTRADQAVQQKLNALADGMAKLMAAQKHSARGSDLSDEIEELRAAVGLEQRESA